MNDPASLSNANALLREHGLRPRKRWGQNFLCDKNALDRIVRASALASGERALEIGPGLGALTIRLAEIAASVTAVEIDTFLEPILKQTLAPYSNIRVLYQDFLKVNLPKLLDEAFGDQPGVVVANIPYYITTPILESLLKEKRRVRRIVLLVQQEFAERMVAAPDTEAYGAMSVFAQYHAKIELCGIIPRTVFLPHPDVSSAVIALTPVSPGSLVVQNESAFFRIARAAFGQRRKTLPNALIGAKIGLDRERVDRLLAEAGISPARRGETLSLAEFAAIADCWAEAPVDGQDSAAMATNIAWKQDQDRALASENRDESE